MSENSKLANIQDLLNFIGHVDHSTLRTETQTLCAHLQESHTEIVHLYENQNWQRLSIIAHSFKSNCIYLGAKTLREVSEKLEYLESEKEHNRERLFETWLDVYKATFADIKSQLNGER